MVFEDDCTQLILKEFPDFAASDEWKEHLKFWGDEETGLCTNMSRFSHYVSDMLKQKIPEKDVPKIFNFIEYLMNEGDQDVQDAAATCFLENLINFTSNSGLDPKTFVHLLGPESREYCKAWDEFTGVKTEGLWD